VPRVLFVCTGNICRSPMAAALLFRHLQKSESDWQTWHVDSAGTWATPGQNATSEAQQVMKDMGLDISEHRSRLVTAELMEPFNLILTMESGQKEALKVEFPKYARRIYMLSEMVGEQDPIRDPTGGTLNDYVSVADLIDRKLQNGLPRIRHLAKNLDRFHHLLKTSQ
jgi:protein-tyrosine phosphatase